MAEGGNDVLEGFLCPICKADLGTAVKLLSHFEKEHKEDKDALQVLKELFGKAKKKIIKNDFSIQNEFGSYTGTSRPSASYSSFREEPQSIGQTRSHTEYFVAVRNKHLEHYTVETNKLLFRLDKILKNLPSDPHKRKAHEQSVVHWVDEKDVKLCPTCGKSFHLTRRKHHCRLCGFVMCNDCSLSLDLKVARKMASPLSQGVNDSDDSTTSKDSSSASSLSHGSSRIRRSNSSSSLNSVLSLVESVQQLDLGLRVCSECIKLLESREAVRESRSARPIITQFYERLRGYIQDANEHIPIYQKMCSSLNRGEAIYDLGEAIALWSRLLRLTENIDSLSQKISVLGSADKENPPKGSALKLQHQIRIAATAYLRREMIGLPSLPSETKYRQLQELRRQEVKARIQQEQLEAQQEAERMAQIRGRKGKDRSFDFDTNFSKRDRDFTATQQNVVLPETGWVPEKAQFFTSDDPVVQQMNIIRHYIKEAKLAQRHDEVAALEQNLKELNQEYWRQQQQKQDQKECDS